MPRSSRSKSHKQSKHSSKEAAATVQDYSDLDEDVKTKERNSNGGKEDVVPVRVSKDALVSGEKRKLSKDMSNGDVSEDQTTSSKRRKEKSHGGSDRWNGGNSEEKVEVVSIDTKELAKSKDLSKSKSSKRHDAAASTSVVAVEKDESKSVGGSRGEKRRSERDSGKKEGHRYEESKEVKDKDRKVKDGKREAEALLKQADNQQSKRGRENSELLIEEELRNPELEKELEKRIRRRGEGFNDRDKYQDDVKEGDDRMLSTRSGRAKDAKHKDEGYGDKYRAEGDRETRRRDDRYREDGERVSKSRDAKYRGESERDSKHRDDKYREDGERDRRREGKYREDGNRDSRYKDDKYHEDGERNSKHRDDKYREGGDKDKRSRDDKHRQDDDRDYRHKEEKHREGVDRDYRHRDGRLKDDTDRERTVRDSKYKDVHISRDHPSESETKSLRDDVAAELHHKKTHNREGSPTYADRAAKYKDDKGRRRDNDKDEPDDYKSRSNKDQHSESEKRPMGSAKIESVSQRGRPNSRDVDMEITTDHSRRRNSPSGKFYPTRDHYRVSKAEEAKYRDHGYEERSRHSVHPSRDFTSAPGKSDKISSSAERISQKDDEYIGDLSAERRRRLDVRSSPLVDKSPSSASNERKQRTSGSKDAKEYSDNDGKGSRELGVDPHPDHPFPQFDGDNLSVSSPCTKNGHFSGNSKSLLPPPTFRTGPDSPSGIGHPEDDNRGKSNNRHRRMGDPNMGRAQSGWKNVPSWPSPLGNGGYLPFQQVPPPMFHPVMQQFPPPMFGRPQLKPNHNGMPYHVPDADRFSGHGWEANNTVFGDESHVYGRLDWDRARTHLSNRGWEWKTQNSSTSVGNEHLAHRPADEIWSGKMGNEQTQLDFQADTMNISPSGNAFESNTLEAPKVTDGPHTVKEDDAFISHVYLSKIDVSEHLTEPELYDQCTDMLGLDQADCKILVLEEDLEANITDGASLYAAVNDSVFQKAMSLYKKQKEELGAMYKEKAPRFITNGTECVQKVKADLEPAVDGGKEKDEPTIQNLDTDREKDDIVPEIPDKSQEHILTSHPTNTQKQEEEPESTKEEKTCKLEESFAPPSEAVVAAGGFDQKVKDGDGCLLLDPDVSMECGSVNLSRIHDH